MKKLYILSSLVLGVAFTSCYDLDTKPMSSTITSDQRDEYMEADESKILGLSDGIYKYYNENEWFAGDLYDFGYPSIMLQLDARTADYISANADDYGWFAGCAEYTDNTANNGYNIVRWSLPYGIIFAANQLIGFIPEDKKADDFYKSMLGQAYGNRAFAYWFLAQLFQWNYVGHEEDPCVPLITEKNYAEVQEKGAPRATVQEIYDQILTDLNNGIEMMTDNPSAIRTDKRYIDINVLYALRARTYLCMQEYEKAEADAQTVIDSGAFQPLSAEEAMLPGFSDINAKNWIWGIYYAQEDVMGLYTHAGMTGSYTYGYAYAGMWKCITDRLFEDISYNDPRKYWWIDPNTGQSNAQYYTNAVLNPNMDNMTPEEFLNTYFYYYAVTKFAPYQNLIGQSNNMSDVPLIRIEEMYYILAEAKAQGMKELDAGREELENFVNEYRVLNLRYPYSVASTGRTLMEEIFWQREVEFWGEGITYFDIMRLNLGVDRTNTSWDNPTYGMDAYAFNIRPGNPVLLMQIPTSELDNNPALSRNDQNPVGSAN